AIGPVGFRVYFPDLLCIVTWNQPTGGRADIGKRDRLPLRVAGKLAHLQLWTCDDDRVIDRFVVVFHGGDRLAIGRIVGDDVTPRPHPGEVHLLTTHSHGQARPVGGCGQIVLDA